MSKTVVSKLAARLGSLFWVLWGAVHLNAARGLMKLGQHAPLGAMIQARIYQDAAIVIIVIALTMNWRNSAVGYWINLGLAFFLDLPFVLFVLDPGFAPLWPGLQGPIAFAVAATFSGVALVTRPKSDILSRATVETAQGTSDRAADLSREKNVVRSPSASPGDRITFSSALSARGRLREDGQVRSAVPAGGRGPGFPPRPLIAFGQAGHRDGQ